MEHGAFDAVDRYNGLRVGQALGKSFAIWFKNLPAFLLLSTVAYSPNIIYTAVVTSGSLSLADLGEWSVYSIVSTLVGFLLLLTACAAILYGVIQQLRGHRAGIGESLGVGLKRLLPALGVGILCFLAVCGWIFVGSFFAALIPLVGFLFGIAGFVASLISICKLFVAVPASVIERPGIVGALRRSKELTHGYRGRIFLILLLLVAIFVAMAILGFTMNTGDEWTEAGIKLFMWIQTALSIVWTSLTATVMGVVYHDLRAIKDGVGAEELARVFE